MGVYDDIFVMNLEEKTSFVEGVLQISKAGFAYVVPVDIFITDYFTEATSHGPNNMYYYYYLMERLYKENSETMVLACDSVHAKLYEDIDHYLKMVRKRKEAFKSCSNRNVDFTNILMVMNNIEEIDNAAVFLAGMILSTDLDTYPSVSDKKWNTVFDIDYHDWLQDVAYFKRHIDRSLTVENLLNFSPYNSDPLKQEFIHRIIKYIFKNLTYDEFIGKGYSEYKVLQIRDKTDAYLQGMRGYLITDYEIMSVRGVISNTNPGTRNINIRTMIMPIGTTERYEVSKTVNV